LSLGVAANGQGVAEGPVLKLCGIVVLVLDGLVNIRLPLGQFLEDLGDFLVFFVTDGVLNLCNEGCVHGLELIKRVLLLGHFLGKGQGPGADMGECSLDVTFFWIDVRLGEEEGLKSRKKITMGLVVAHSLVDEGEVIRKAMEDVIFLLLLLKEDLGTNTGEEQRDFEGELLFVIEDVVLL